MIQRNIINYKGRCVLEDRYAAHVMDSYPKGGSKGVDTASEAIAMVDYFNKYNLNNFDSFVFQKEFNSLEQ